MTEAANASSPASPEASSAPGSAAEPTAGPSRERQGWPYDKDKADPAAPAAAGAEPAMAFTQSQLNQLFAMRADQQQFARRGEFLAALARARAAFKAIHRSKLVNIQPREGRAYTFTYAPMDVILAALDPALTAEGFTLSQQLVWDEKHGECVLTELMHPMGELANRYPIYCPDRPSSKDHAGAVTYARRYGLSLLMCVAADDDTEEEVDKGQTRSPAAPPPAAQPPQKPPAPKPAAKPAQEAPPPITAPTDPESIAQAEGQIADAIQEMLEACAEGRRVGIEQIWGELKANPYIAGQVWDRMKAKHKDAFATMKAVLKPSAEKPSK